MTDKMVFGPRLGRTAGLAMTAALGVLGACSGAEPDDAAAATTQVPMYADVTATSGVDHSYTGEFEYFVGGGVATFDCDDDGRPELYFAGGSSPAALYRNQRSTDGGVAFEQLTSPVTDLTDVTGAYPLDIDSDGLTDLVVLRRGENVVLAGTGDCGFERANERWGIDGGTDWTTAFSATWEIGETWPTLAFGSYLATDRESCGDSLLLRPDPTNGRYGEAERLTPGYCTLSMLFSDWDRNGQRDLRLTNDRHYYTDGEDQLWRVVPGEAPRLYGVADGWQPVHIWGMGIASEDLTGDGRPEIFLTSQGDNKLQSLRDGATGPDFGDLALRRGVTAQRPFAGDDVRPSTAWHPQFADVNNDGRADLFVTKGNVEAQPDFAMADPNNLLLQQADGTFVEAADRAGVFDVVSSRGAAVVDLDLDGLLDIVVVHRRAPASILHNLGSGTDKGSAPLGHWLEVRVRQPAPNVDAIGAWIELRQGDRIASHEVTVGGGHLSGRLGWQHFGLGNSDEAQVRVQWPDGEVGPWQTIDADTAITIDRSAMEPLVFVPDT